MLAKETEVFRVIGQGGCDETTKGSFNLHIVACFGGEGAWIGSVVSRGTGVALFEIRLCVERVGDVLVQAAGAISLCAALS